MALQSMTGFARAEGNSQTADWVWEMRSVNGKSLDLRFRLPSGFETLEPSLREIAAARMSRGNIQITLQVEWHAGSAVPTVNREAFGAVHAAALKLHGETGLALPSLGELMQVRGVIEMGDSSAGEAEREALASHLLAGYTEAVNRLVAARTSEGEAIAAALGGHVGRIEALRRQVEADPSRSPQAIQKRLAQAIERLTGESSTLDPERLHQEAVLLATRADLAEELDRLTAHVEAATTLLASGEAVGRKLDFLAQEFNRECNTICSKSNAASVTAAGLEMKAAIDQFREQVQNIQ